MRLQVVTLVLQLHEGVSALEHVSDVISSYLGPPPNLSLARACTFGSTPLLDWIWESSCTTEADRKPNWTLTNYLRSEIRYGEWQFDEPMVVAAQRGNLAILQWLLDHYSECSVDITVVEAAAQAGHLHVLQFLHQQGATFGQPSWRTHPSLGSWRVRELNVAAVFGHSDIIRWRIEEQDTIDDQATRDLLVYSAAGRGDVSLLEFLLEHGFHYNEEYLAQDATGAVIEWLLERTPRTQNSEVVRPLLLASAKEGRADLIARIAAGSFPRRKNLCRKLELCCENTLAVACRYGQLDVVQMMLDFGLSFQLGLSHPTVMGDAAALGHLKVAKLLQARCGLRVNREKAIFLAAANGHLDVVQWLYETPAATSSGAFHPGPAWFGKIYVQDDPILKDLQASSAKPATAMDAAATFGHLDVVRYLHGATTSRGTKRKFREGGVRLIPHATSAAMDGAAAMGHLEVVKWLHARRSEGCTMRALDGAIANNHFDVMEWLFANRSDGFSLAALCSETEELTSLRSLQWCVNIGGSELACAVEWGDFLVRYARRGVLPVVQWLLEEFPSCAESIESAISEPLSAGVLDMVLFLDWVSPRTLDFPVDENNIFNNHTSVVDVREGCARV